MSLLLIATSARAAVPAAASSDPRYELGYIVVTDYPGVTNDGTGDSTAGIQAAITDAFASSLAVLFPAGTYIVSDTLKCYAWNEWDPTRNAAGNSYGQSVLVGSTTGAARPIIKLAAKAALFDNASAPRPVLVYRQFGASNVDGNSHVEPTDPLLGVPPNYVELSDSLFAAELRGIDFDTSTHAGAIGVSMTAAQASSMTDVSVTATGSYAGIYGVPGRDMGAANIFVEGGQIGIIIAAAAGPVLVGITLSNQTKVAIQNFDFVPVTIVGFHIKGAVAPVLSAESAGTAVGVYSLIDGIVELKSGGVPFANRNGNNLYIHNVFVTGSSSLVQSDMLPAVVGGGRWSQIADYAYTNQAIAKTPYTGSEMVFDSYALIEGLASRTAEASTKINADVAAPADLVAQHVWGSFPAYEGQKDGSINVADAPYSVVANGMGDSLAMIQKAIDDASTSGNGHVFLPRGTYLVSNTITLHANTVLTGISQRITEIGVHPRWQPTAGQVPVVTTDDDAAATTLLAFLSIRSRALGGGTDAAGATTYDRFEQIEWKAGRGSATVGIGYDSDYNPGVTNPRDMFGFSGSGGGRHYFTWLNTFNCGNAGFRGLHVKSTHEPLWLYGLNAEMCRVATTGNNTGWSEPSAVAEIDSASNVRVLSMKREERAGSLIIKDSTNIALVSSGNMLAPAEAPAYVQVLGASTQVVLANILAGGDGQELPNGMQPMVSEALTGSAAVAVMWPSGVTLYARGMLDDSAVAIGGSTIGASDGGVLDSRPVANDAGVIVTSADSGTSPKHAGGCSIADTHARFPCMLVFGFVVLLPRRRQRRYSPRLTAPSVCAFTAGTPVTST